MNELNTILQEAVIDGDVPFAVATVGTSEGISWSGAAGERTTDIMATEDTIFRLFSMTKGIGATAAMILVDRGKLNLHTPVESILPEFAERRILDRFDNDIPHLSPPKAKATIQHLATHTSGCVYGVWNSDILKYGEVTKKPSLLQGWKEALNIPLIFEPGDRWYYGPGIDWLGLVVEAIDGRPIDKFCREEIFDPLAMADTVFELDERTSSRLATVKTRNESGQFVAIALTLPSKPEFYGMGHALYSTAPDYLRFLRMFLNKGQLDGTRILSEASVDLMLENHIGALRVRKLVTTSPSFSNDLDFFPAYEKSHSFGFMRMEEDVPEMRKSGSQFWAGVCNTHYWFDPAQDLAGIIMTQTLPFSEPRFMKFYERFEKAVYANITA